MWMFVSVYATCVCVCTNEGQKRVLDPLELESRVVVRCLIRLAVLLSPPQFAGLHRHPWHPKSILLCKSLVNCKVLTPEAVRGWGHDSAVQNYQGKNTPLGFLVNDSR